MAHIQCFNIFISKHLICIYFIFFGTPEQIIEADADGIVRNRMPRIRHAICMVSDFFYPGKRRSFHLPNSGFYNSI